MKKRQVNFWNTYELKYFCINVLLWLLINICSTCWIHTDIWRHGHQPFSRGWQQTDVDDSSCEDSKVIMNLGIVMLPGPPCICDRMFMFCFCFFSLSLFFSTCTGKQMEKTTSSWIKIISHHESREIIFCTCMCFCGLRIECNVKNI